MASGKGRALPQQTQKLKPPMMQSGGRKWHSRRKLQRIGRERQTRRGLVEELENDEKLARQLDPILGRLQKAHALLEIEGVTLPPLNLPSKSDSRSPAKKKTEVPANDLQSGAPRPASASSRMSLQFSSPNAAAAMSRSAAASARQASHRWSVAIAVVKGNRPGQGRREPHH